MRLEPCAALAVLLALAACGGTGKQDEAKPEQKGSAPAAAPASASPKLNPGQWEMVVQAGAMTAPNMPPEVARMMKGTTVTTKYCITPEEANRPTGKTFGGKTEGDCKQSEFSLEGGRLHSVLTCSSANGAGGTTVSSDGTYGGDSFDVRSKMTMSAGKGNMSMESHVVGRRIGACSGKEAG